MMRIEKMAALSLVCLVVACGASANPKIASPKPDSVKARAWNRMHEDAAVSLQCPIESLTTTPLSGAKKGSQYNATFKVEGCGKEEMVATFSGPTSWIVYSDQDLRKKVAFSFDGKCDDVSISFVDDNTRGVDACGTKIIYVMTDAGWIANTEAE